MHGKLVDNRVLMDFDEPELHQMGYGRIKKDEKEQTDKDQKVKQTRQLELSLEEAVYLLDRNTISVSLDEQPLNLKDLFIEASCRIPDFEARYITYKDLRGRGYYIQPSKFGFRLYPRGGKPGKTPASFYVFVAPEREIVPVADLIAMLDTVINIRKRLMTAIVDEEGDITFYEVTDVTMKGEREPPCDITAAATFLNDRCIVWEDADVDKLHTYSLGKMVDDTRLQLSLVEAGYLLKKGLITITIATPITTTFLDTKDDRQNDMQRELDIGSLSALCSGIDPDFPHRFTAYCDLMDSGMIPKTGFKFGSHFRVYEGGDLKHSRFLVHAITSDHTFVLQVLSRAVRLANSVHKEMVFAVVDGGDVRYVSINRAKP